MKHSLCLFLFSLTLFVMVDNPMSNPAALIRSQICKQVSCCLWPDPSRRVFSSSSSRIWSRSASTSGLYFRGCLDELSYEGGSIPSSINVRLFSWVGSASRDSLFSLYFLYYFSPVVLEIEHSAAAFLDETPGVRKSMYLKTVIWVCTF